MATKLIRLALFLAACSSFEFTLACGCRQPELGSALRQPDGLVFRGTVLREVVPSSTDDNGAQRIRKYIVQVARVIKGCTIKPMERVLVTSFGGPEMCGEILDVNGDYLLSAPVSQPILDNARAELGNKSKATQTLWITACGVNKTWDSVSGNEKQLIRAHGKERCSAATA
jgi:hypothetical protein